MKYYFNLERNQPFVSEVELKDDKFFEITQDKFSDIMLGNVPAGTKYVVSDGELIIDKQQMDSKRASNIRMVRNKLLSASDWAMFPDSPLTPEQREKWVTYRQALRDIPQQSGFPENVIYPEKP